MQLLIFIFNLYFINLNVLGIFSTLLKANIKNQSNMSLRDKNICIKCIDYIDKLSKLKNSSACENDELQSQLICYEIYYYFYYFKPNFYFQNLKEVFHEKKCDICSKLDKCQFNECVENLDFDKRNYKNNKLRTKEIYSRSDESTITENNIKEKREFEKAIHKINNFNYSLRYDMEKHKKIDSEGKKFKFLAINSKNTNTFNSDKNILNFLNDYSLDKINFNQKQYYKLVNTSNISDIVFEHMNILKLKITHALDEIFNLGSIHKNAKQLKHELINLVIYNKLKHEHKTDLNKNSTLVRIKNKALDTNYLDNLKKLSKNFIKLHDKFENKINQKISFLSNNNSYNSDFNKVDLYIGYLTHLVQSYNEMLRLGQIISESNIKLFDFISTHFSLGKFQNEKTVKNTNLFTNVTDFENSNYQTRNKTKYKINEIAKNSKYPKFPESILFSDFKILLDKVTKLEYEQEKFQQIFLDSHLDDNKKNSKNILNNDLENNQAIKISPLINIDIKHGNSPYNMQSNRKNEYTNNIKNYTNTDSEDLLSIKNILERPIENSNLDRLVSQKRHDVLKMKKNVNFGKLIERPEISSIVSKKLDNKFLLNNNSNKIELKNFQYPNTIHYFKRNIPPSYLTNINSHSILNYHEILNNSQPKKNKIKIEDSKKDIISIAHVDKSTNYYNENKYIRSNNRDYNEQIENQSNKSHKFGKASLEKKIKENANTIKTNQLNFHALPSLTGKFFNEIKSVKAIQPNQLNLKTVNSFFQYDQENKKKTKEKKKKYLKNLNKFYKEFF